MSCMGNFGLIGESTIDAVRRVLLFASIAFVLIVVVLIGYMTGETRLARDAAWALAAFAAFVYTLARTSRFACFILGVVMSTPIGAYAFSAMRGIEPFLSRAELVVAAVAFAIGGGVFLYAFTGDDV